LSSNRDNGESSFFPITPPVGEFLNLLQDAKNGTDAKNGDLSENDELTETETADECGTSQPTVP
jgi:hypothetical protein